MVGVEHGLSGRYCSCFAHTGCDCHALTETHIDRESDANFGFHLTSSGERRQLLNFYRHLFQLPDFDPRRMAESTEDPDRGKLENYLDNLVPNMRKKLSDRNRTDIKFPRLGNRLEGRTADGQTISHFHMSCTCKEHNVMGLEGISHCQALASERDEGCTESYYSTN